MNISSYNSQQRKGIILAGGSGTRLYPITKYVCKQLVPVYNQPMIYYPLYTLIKAGIRDILIISTPQTTPILEKNLGDGSEFGCKFSYKVQDEPNGLAQAFVLGKEFIGDDKVCLILGDNIFYGEQAERMFEEACQSDDNIIFGYPVSDPERYGVVEFDNNDNVISIEEKPKEPKSNYAVPGIYFYNNDVIEIAESLKPSARGEYEITDVNKAYLGRGSLKVKRLAFGNAYLDTGTFDSLNDASNFVRMMKDRTGLNVADISQFLVE